MVKMVTLQMEKHTLTQVHFEFILFCKCNVICIYHITFTAMNAFGLYQVMDYFIEDDPYHNESKIM